MTNHDCIADDNIGCPACRAEGVAETSSIEHAAKHPAEPVGVTADCPTCNGRQWVNGRWVATRETVGMVCQTCGHDYAAEPVGVSRERLVELLKAELPSAYQFMAWSLVETLVAAGALRVDPPACGAENTRHPEWRWGPCVFTTGHHDHTREDWNSHADRLGRTWNDQPPEEES